MFDRTGHGERDRKTCWQHDMANIQANRMAAESSKQHELGVTIQYRAKKETTITEHEKKKKEGTTWTV